MILITGSAGFIGSVLLKKLNELGGDQILLVDRLRKANKWTNLTKIKFADFINADELFTPKYESILKEIKVIYHMGACSNTREKDVDFLIKNNYEFSKDIFKLATKNQAKLIYASSAATYGDGEEGYCDDHETIHKLSPLNPYGFSKYIFDIWALRQKETPPLWLGIKFFNVFGPNEYHKGDMCSVVYKAFHQIKKIKKVRLFKSYRQPIADGEQKRDFIYVLDVVKALTQMLECHDQQSGIYNLGTGQARTFNDLTWALFKSMDCTPQIEYIDMPKDLITKYQYFTQADMQKFYTLLPDFEFTKLETSINDYVKNYLNLTDPYL